ncbi:MAG: hypothetical protein ACFB16_09865 [Phormidesmis sp.]
MNNFLQSIHFTWRLRAFRWWMLACFIAMPLGTVLNKVLILFTMPLGASGYYSHSGGWLIGEGLALGVCQWLVLRRYFTQAHGWLVATAVGSALASIIYAFSSYGLHLGLNAFSWLPAVPVVSNLYCLPAALGLGLGLGTMQWFFLRSRVDHAEYWIGAVLAAQLMVKIIEFVPLLPQPDLFSEMLMTTPPPSLTSLMAVGILKFVLMGLFQGVFTGWVLAGFVAAQKRASVSIFS